METKEQKALLKEFEYDDNEGTIFILFEESLYDYQIAGRKVTAFKGKKAAQKAFNKAKKTARKIAKTNNWEIGHDDDSFFEAYPDGSFPESHEVVELVKVEEGGAIYLHG